MSLNCLLCNLDGVKTHTQNLLIPLYWHIYDRTAWNYQLCNYKNFYKITMILKKHKQTWTCTHYLNNVLSLTILSQVIYCIKALTKQKQKQNKQTHNQ